MPVKLYPHQQDALDRMFNGCILYGGVGSGKSLTAVSYYMKVEADADVYVITTARKRDSLDWESDFVKFGVGRHLNATVAGALTVDSWHNLEKYTGIEGAFFIFDEQKLVGAGAWSRAFLEIAKRNRWILLSATPGDTWLDYIPVFLAHGFYKNRSEFKRKHVVYSSYTKFPKVERYTDVGRLVRLRNQLLVHMPYARHTTRHLVSVPCEYDVEQFERVLVKRWHVYEDRPLRDVGEMFIVMRKVANTHPSRLEEIRKLWEKHPKLIVFYNFDYELELLRTLKCELSTASENDSISGSTSSSTKQPKNASLLNDTSGSNTSSIRKERLSILSLTTPTKAEQLSDIGSKSGLRTSSFMKIRSESSSDLVDRSTLPTDAEQNEVEPSKTLENTKLLEKSSSTSSEPSPMISGSGSKSSAKSTPSQVSEWNGHKHQPIPQTDRWLYLVQYQAGAEAWNCIETDAIAFYSLTYSYKIWEQAMGRIDRLNTPFAKLFYYILKSSSEIDTAIWKSLSNKESFNEKSIHIK